MDIISVVAIAVGAISGMNKTPKKEDVGYLFKKKPAPLTELVSPAWLGFSVLCGIIYTAILFIYGSSH
jgi:hypothetical protein